MFWGKFFKRLKSAKLSMRSKLVLSLLSIAAILLVSSTISVLEYRSMSNYVSELISDDISSINVANRLSDIIFRFLSLLGKRRRLNCLSLIRITLLPIVILLG